jgi:hypothetical protein
VFRNISKAIEPGLFAQGQAFLWWTIVFFYWVIDVTLVICSIAFFRWPINLRRSDKVSFLALSSEIAIVVLFLHLAWLTTDPTLRERIVPIGLGGLTVFFLAMMSVWMLVVILRYEPPNHADDATDERESRIKWPAGRRTTMLTSPSHVRYRGRPK